MLTTTKQYWLLLPILLLAFLIRFININSYPSLNPDEAALGYNAYSLLETGKDEHGISWPVHFKSFGDFKPGGYVYLALPFIKVLGLTPLAVRLPNLILSLLCIFFLYRLVLHLTKNHSLALLTSLVLTLSPWHIHFSRGAWEASAALSFTVIGVYYFIRSLDHSLHLKHMLTAVIFFVFSLYTYHSARLVVPLLVLSISVYYYQALLNNFKKLLIPLIFGIVIAAPVLFSFLNSGGSARFGGVGLFADQGPLWRSHELLNHHGSTDIYYRLIHNQRVLYLLSWAEKYVSHFGLNFLFLNGDEVPRSRSPDMGQLYLLELPFLLLGLSYLFSRKLSPKIRFLFLSWLLIGPIASSLTFQAPSALRSLPLVIPLSFLIALGIFRLFSLSKLVPLLLFPLYLLSVLYFFDAYFVHAQKRYPFAWNTGFDTAVPFLNSLKDQYPSAYFTTTYDQPYILYLFYSAYDPSLLHPQIQLTPPDKFGFSTVAKIDNIHFGIPSWEDIPSQSLIFTSPDDNLPATPSSTLYFPNGQPSFKIFIKP